MAKQAEKKPVDPAEYVPKPPKQVQEQIAAAEALRAEMNMDAAPPETPETPETPPADSQQPPTEDTPPPPQQPVQQPDDGQSWEQRYKSLQGRLESSQKTNQALTDRLGQLEMQVASLKVRGAEEERPPAAVPSVKPKLITEEEAKEYGDEFLTVVGKRAKEEFLPEFDNLAERLKRLESRVEGVGTIIDKNQVTNVYSTLAEQVPEWREINKAPEFKAWLQIPDPYSGRRRHDMLTEAFTRHETGRVVSFFRGFLTEATGSPPSASSPGTSAPHPNGSGKPSLEQFAAPGRARSAPQDLPPDKPIYTQAWIAQFSADKLMGKFRGREADADAIERDIYQAQHEGRIH